MLRMLLLGTLLQLFVVIGFAADDTGGLSTIQIQDLLESVPLNGPTRVAMNAVTNNDIKDLALNRGIAGQSDDIFSFKLPTKGITDQEKTGRCWLFAGMNLMRQKVAKQNHLDDFELSQSYLAFWDRLEKANVFLEFIIETRKRDLLDREVDHMLDDPISDGGYWEYVVNLVGKYGVLPKKFMQETKSSADTKRMDYVLSALLRRDAIDLRTLGSQGKDLLALRAEKNEMLKDILRVLVINYGMPPAEFEWRTESDSGKVSDPTIYTPLSFYRDVVGGDLSNYVSLADYPIHPASQHYSIALTRSMADQPDIDFVNIEGQQLKEIALRALLDSNRVWFGCDMSHDVDSKRGMMAKGLYDYEDLFGIRLEMTKKERLNYRHSASNHAMVLVGVDVIDGKPTRWRVENSWGKERGDNGFFTMTDEWFDHYVLNIIVPKDYLTPEMLAAYRKAPIQLPVWDPVWSSLRW